MAISLYWDTVGPRFGWDFKDYFQKMHKWYKKCWKDPGQSLSKNYNLTEAEIEISFPVPLPNSGSIAEIDQS